MPLPKRLQIGPFAYTVEGRSNLEKEAESFGVCLPDQQLILIDTEQGLDQQAEGLVHEALHGLWELAGLDQKWPDTDGGPGEKIISRLGPLLLDFLRRNKAAVNYLVG